MSGTYYLEVERVFGTVRRKQGVPFDTHEDAELAAGELEGAPLDWQPVWGDHAWEAEGAISTYTIRWYL